MDRRTTTTRPRLARLAGLLPTTGLLAGAVLAGAALAGAIGAIGGDPAPTADERTHHVHTVDVADLTDDRQLVGLADDVFVASVVRERGGTIGEPLPETQFDVQVVEAIKGTLAGEVVVSQQGGADGEGNTVVVNDDRPLTVGRTYLFASLTNDATGWHTLIPVHGTRLAGTGAARAALVDRFEAAVGT